jgi:hypothetical protein
MPDGTPTEGSHVPTDEITLTRRVLSLRETSADSEDFAQHLRDELEFSESESTVVARILEDRFLSHGEQLELLGLDLHRALSEGSTVGGFLGRLAGADGREATRHHARSLANSLAPAAVEGERPAMTNESIRELAELLPRAGIDAGGISPVTYGIYSYLQPRDSALVALAAEIRGNWESSTNPILCLRSARVLAESGNSRAAEFVRESEACLTASYSGGLTMDERIFRAAGLAIDGNQAATRFLLNLSMNPRESVSRRSWAMDYLPPASLDNGSDAVEVFRSLVEDPEEPVATRYRMLSLLARAPHPPEAAWWHRMLNDPTMRVSDRHLPDGAAAGGSSSGDFSEWNLVVAALSSSHSDFATGLLRDIIYTRGASLPTRREALMAYIHRNNRGHLSWEVLREVLALPPGEWDGILTEVADGVRPLRLRFPRPTGATSELSAGESVDTEIVLELRPGGAEGWVVDFRPLDREHDPRVATSEPTVYESYLPANRRINLGGISGREITTEMRTSTPTGTGSRTTGNADTSNPDASTAPSSNGQNAAVGGSALGI